MIPFGRWSPGVSDTTVARSDVIEGVIPLADGGYAPIPQFQTVSGADALASAPRGHISLLKAGGTAVRFFATASNWYSQDAAGAFTSVASGHSVPSGAKESFLRFGDKLLGTNTADGLRAYDFETSTDDGTISAAPSASFAFECGNTVVALVGDIIQNSALNDHTDWTNGGADYQPIEGGGPLVAGVAVSQGSAFIFQREAIRYMQFGGSGGGALYSLSLVTERAGATSPQSVVAAAGGAFFMDTDGPKFVVPGSLPVSIGAQDGIDRWLADNMTASSAGLVEGAYDRFRRIVWWRVPLSGDSDEVFSAILGYHIDYAKWTLLRVNTSALFSTSFPGSTWSDLTGTWDSYSAYTWGSRFWQGGEPLFGGLDSAYKLALFSGTPMTATLETTKSYENQSVMVNDVTAITDAANATVQLRATDRLSDTTTAWKPEVSLTDSGVARLRGRGKIIQFRLKTTAGEDWSYATGFDHINRGLR